MNKLVITCALFALPLYLLGSVEPRQNMSAYLARLLELQARAARTQEQNRQQEAQRVSHAQRVSSARKQAQRQL